MPAETAAARAERALLAHVRHELLVPVNAVVGFAGLLLEDAGGGALEPEILRDLESIRNAGRDLLGSVNRILEAGEADARGAAFRHEVRTLVDTVLGYSELVAEVAEGRLEAAFLADLDRIRRAAGGILALLDDIVNLSTGQAPAALDGQTEGMVREIVAAAGAEAGGGAALLKGRILVVDDNEIDRSLLARLLAQAGHAVEEAGDGPAALEALANDPADLVLLDVFMPGMNGYQVLERLKGDRKLRHLPVIMLSSWAEERVALRCMELGAEECLAKPVDGPALKARIHASLVRKRARDGELAFLLQLEAEKAGRFGEWVAGTPAMKPLVQALEKAAAQPGPILVLGEVGTGKEMVARQIHRRSRPVDAPFFSVDCAQIVETPWGDKLFGENRAEAGGSSALCYMQLVEGGTLLLKNLEALPAGVQARLASHLEAARGGRGPDVRIVFATRGSLAALEAAPGMAALVAATEDRRLVVPPLRDRKRDIPKLAAAFMKRKAERLGKDVRSLDDAALSRLVTYDYGFANVRELEEAIERAVVLSDGPVIASEEVFLGHPVAPRRPGLNLLKLPGRLVAFATRKLPAILRVCVALGFSAILLACFIGPPAVQKAGTLLIWAIWWPAVTLSFLVVGRGWCAVCPMSASGRLAQRFLGRERKLPEWMKRWETGLVMGGFFAILLVEEAVRMREGPVATGLLLVAIAAGAVACGILYPRQAWCRHLCPFGAFAGTCASSAALEVRPTLDICSAKCAGHACYKGEGAAAGCPTFQHVMFLDSNRNCVLCLACLQSCPNGSPRLNLRWPGQELWAGGADRSGHAWITVLLLGLLVGQALIQQLEQARGLSLGLAPLFERHRALSVTALLSLCAGLPVVALALARRRAGEAPFPWTRIAAWIALAATGFAAFQLGFVPILSSTRLSLAWEGRVLSMPLAGLFQAGLVAGGLTLTAVALLNLRWREEPRRPWRREWPWLAGAAAYSAGLLALLLA